MPVTILGCSQSLASASTTVTCFNVNSNIGTFGERIGIAIVTHSDDGGAGLETQVPTDCTWDGESMVRLETLFVTPGTRTDRQTVFYKLNPSTSSNCSIVGTYASAKDNVSLCFGVASGVDESLVPRFASASLDPAASQFVTASITTLTASSLLVYPAYLEDSTPTIVSGGVFEVTRSHGANPNRAVIAAATGSASPGVNEIIYDISAAGVAVWFALELGPAPIAVTKKNNSFFLGVFPF